MQPNSVCEAQAAAGSEESISWEPHGGGPTSAKTPRRRQAALRDSRVLAQAAAAALLLAAALGAVAGNHEAGQPTERCYSGPIPAGQASFGYTVSASSNATTFTFAVRACGG